MAFGRWLGVSVLPVLIACGGEVTGADEPVSAVIEPIIGGVSATATYPEAALLDMKTSTGSTYACSATLIAPKVVLTAGHCVDGFVSWDVYVNGSYRAATRGETYDWKENGATSVNPDHHDIGLVYLEDAVTLASYPVLAQSKAGDATPALNVGRILNGALTSSLYDAATTLHDGNVVGFPYDYYGNDVIEHGDSGGPVFLTNTHNLVAVNSGVGGGTEVLARVDLLYSWIQQRIAAQTPAPAPTTPAPTVTPPAPTPTSTCTQEIEGNDSFATANPAASVECGGLESGTDQDWFTFAATPGTAMVVLAPTGDAVMQIGFVSKSTCVVALTNAKSVRVSASSAATKVCVGITSPKHRTQTYRLSH